MRFSRDPALAILAALVCVLASSCGGSSSAVPPANLSGNPAQNPGATSLQFLYAPNFPSPNGNNGSITVYPATANGNVTPSNVITGPATNLSGPFAVAFDSKGNMYVSEVSSCVFPAPGITVYAPGASGNATPSRTIAGSNTGLHFPQDVALDSAGNIYVSNPNLGGEPSITVYAPGANGNVAPERTITNALLISPIGLALDSAGTLYVDEGDAIEVFPPGANGDVAPTRTISGDNTGIRCCGGSLLALH